VQVERLGRGPVDGPQEFEPFLMAMALHALADDLAGGDVERGENPTLGVTEGQRD
jgi:hypothetical protein